MSSSIFEAFIPLAQELKQRPDGEYLLAFALKSFFTHHRIEKAQDREKAEHKRHEHVRVQAEGEKPRHREESGRDEVGERRGRGRGRDRDRGERGERGERGRGARATREAAREAQREVAREAAPAGEALEVPATEVPAEAPGAGEQVAEAPRPSRAKIFFTMGEQDGADADKVVEAVKALAPDVELQDLEVRRSHTFLYVKPEAVEAAVAALDGNEWNGKKVGAEKARRRRR